MEFLDFALGVLVGIANANAKENKNIYQKSNSNRITNLNEIKIQKKPNKKYVPKELKYRFCPKCNKNVKVIKKRVGLKSHPFCPICDYQFKSDSISEEEIRAQSKKIYDSIDEPVQGSVESIPKKNILSMSNDGVITCPNCKKLIPQKAIRCKYCNHYFKTWPKNEKPIQKENNGNIERIQAGDIGIITSGNLKGQKAKVIHIPSYRDDITVRLIDTKYPMSITIRLNEFVKSND